MEAKRTQCTNTAISGKINIMLINEIWTNLRHFGNKGCQKFPFVKTRKNKGHALQIRRLIFASPLGYLTFKGVKKINLNYQYLL